MPPSWVTLLELIQNGEPVDARIPNRPIQQLAQRTEYLKAVVDIIGAAKGAVDLNASVSPNVFEGASVYWNPTTLQYDLALVAFDATDTGLYGGIADSAYVVGICVSKASATRGTIVLNGRVDDVDLAAGVEGGVVTPGPYYLSSTDSGKVVKQKPPIGIMSFFALTETSAIVMPSPREILEDHIHYAIELEYGTTLSTTAGWSTVFDAAVAPTGTVYRYTSEEDEKLDSLFPFQPASAAYFEIDGIGSNEKVVIDNNGIWWVDSVNDPTAYERMTIYYARSVAKTDETVVTSLRPFDESGPLQIVDCFGNPATAGDLRAKLNLVLEEGGDTAAGYLAFKQLTNGQFVRGPIVESLESNSSEISVTYETDEGAALADGSKVGRLKLTFNNPNNSILTGFPVVTSLNNSTQEDYNGVIPYVGLPADYDSNVTYRFDIPGSEAGLSGTYRFYFEAWVLSTTNGVIPTLNVNYTLVPAAALGAAQNLSAITTGSGIMSGVPVGALTPNDYVETIFRPGPTAPVGIEVEPGDQLHVALSRADAGSPSYNGSVGVMRVRFVMEKI